MEEKVIEKPLRIKVIFDARRIPADGKMDVVICSFECYILPIPIKPKQAMPKVRRILSVVIATVGFILSPLSWWNDLAVNIPLAYLFGSLCALLSERLFVPCMVLGYWLTNILGLILMHVGASNTASGSGGRIGIVGFLLISVGYTALIVTLAALGILRLPHLYFR